jgi:phosphoribosylaminoimidazole-succinocarboxamide synthase
LIQHFKDDATAFNAKKHEVIEGKGVLNNRISEYVFQNLNDIGVPTHFIRRLNMREQLIREVEIIPLEIVVRNVAAGSLATRLASRRARNCRARSSNSITRTTSSTIPMVSEEHITAFGWATPQEIDDMMAARHPRQRFPLGPFPRRRHPSGGFQDGMRAAVGKRDDAHRRRRRDLTRFLPTVGHQVEREARQGPLPARPRRLVEAYTEVAKRLGIMNEGEPPRGTGPVLVKG